MLSYCLKCGENTKTLFYRFQELYGGIIILSKWAVCGDKKLKFIRKQEAKGLLNNLVIKTLLSKIPILRDILF